MSEDDDIFLNEYRAEKKAYELISHEELKKEMGL